MFGSDPEFFILDSTGKPVPAHHFFPPKEVPFRHEYVIGSEYIQVYRDGYSVELNIPPRSCRQEFATRVKAALVHTHAKLPTGYTLTTKPTVKIRRSDLDGAPEDVLFFGCDPSRDAYTGEDKSVELNGLTHPYRYAGGHLHYSGEGTSSWLQNRADCDLCVKMLDYYLGLPFTFLFNQADEFQRRKYYGQAGEYRLQSYPNGSQGLEYRVLSPRVLNDPYLLSFCNGVLRFVVQNFMKLREEWNPAIESKVRRTINTGSGLDSWAPTLAPFYTPELIRQAQGMFDDFNFLRTDPYNAWGEWVRTHTGRPLAIHNGDKKHYPSITPFFWI